MTRQTWRTTVTNATHTIPANAKTYPHQGKAIWKAYVLSHSSIKIIETGVPNAVARKISSINSRVNTKKRLAFPAPKTFLIPISLTRAIVEKRVIIHNPKQATNIARMDAQVKIQLKLRLNARQGFLKAEDEA